MLSIIIKRGAESYESSRPQFGFQPKLKIEAAVLGPKPDYALLPRSHLAGPVR